MDTILSKTSIHLFGLIHLFAFASLAFYSNLSGKPTAWVLLGLLLVAWIGCIGAVIKSRSEKKLSFSFILWPALSCVFCLVANPIFEDDFYRYLFDGYALLETGNPYNVLPIEYFGEKNNPFGLEAILDGVGYPNAPTVYGPVLQFFFAIAWWLGGGEIWAWKLVCFLAYVALVSATWFWTKNKVSLVFVLWCPLLAFESLFNLHADIIGAVFLLLAILGLRNQSSYLSGGAFALAIACKPICLVFLPMAFIKCTNRLKTITVFITILLFVYLPFILQGDIGLTGYLEMGKTWEFNSSIFAVLKSLTNFEQSKAICGILLISAIGWDYYQQRKTRDIVEIKWDQPLIAMLLLSPVFNPWYLIWVVPYISVQRSIWQWTLLIVLSLSYLTYGNLGYPDMDSFRHPAWLRPVEFGVLAIAILYYLKFKMKNGPSLA